MRLLLIEDEEKTSTYMSGFIASTPPGQEVMPIMCSTLTTTSVFPRLMSPLNLVPAPPGIRIQQVSD